MICLPERIKIRERTIFEMYGNSESLKDAKIKTENFMGFIRTGSTRNKRKNKRMTRFRSLSNTVSHFL